MKTVSPELHRLRSAVSRHVDGHEGAILVACSGGPDSLALAAAAAALDRPVGGVVVDHGLQPASADVARRAAAQCMSLGLAPVEVVRVRVESRGDGPEAAARRARYGELGRLAEAQGALVLLGHTLDDQAETVLLGLARGSGVRSLAGMPPQRGPFRRPFLGMRRHDVRAVLAGLPVAAWDDPHNDDPAYLRSRVRHRLLPVLEAELGPGVATALARTADLARRDADALDAWAATVGQDLPSLDAGWPADDLVDLPAAVRTRVLRSGALAAGSPANDLTAVHVAELDGMVTDWHGQGPLHLPGRVIAHRRCGRLYLTGEPHGTGERDGA